MLKDQMTTEEHSIPVDEPTCSSEILVEDAKDLVDNSCAVRPDSMMIDPPKPETDNEIVPASQDEPVKIPVPEHQYCLETSNTMGGVGTKNDPATLVSSKCNGNSGSIGLIAEGECIAEAPKGIGPETENSNHPASENVGDIQSGVSGLCLVEEKCKDEVVSSHLDRKMTDSKAPLSSESDMDIFSRHRKNVSNVSLLPSSAGDMLVKDDLHPTSSSVQLCTENTGEGGSVHVVDQFHEPLCPSPISQQTASTELCGKKVDEVWEYSFGGNHLETSNPEHEASGDPHFVETDGIIFSEASGKEELHSSDTIHSAEPTVRLQSSSRALVADVHASENLVSQYELRVDGLLQAVNSISVDDVTCDEIVHKGDSNMAADIGAVEFGGNDSTVRKSSRASKQIVKQPVRSSKKGSKKSAKSADNETLNFLLSAVRNKRSYIRRAARASTWGLTNCLSEHVQRETGPEDQILESAESAARKKQNKVQASTTSLASKGKSCVGSCRVRLKVNLGNGELNSTKHLNVAIDGKNSASCQENSMVESDGRNPSDKEIQHLGSSAEDRRINSGTSPDSEVINQIPDPQTNIDDASPAMHTVRKKKENKKIKRVKKVKASQPNEYGVNDGVCGPLNADNEVGYGNRVCSSNDMSFESQDLRHTKECFPPTKAKGGKQSKVPKGKGKVKNKSNTSDIVDRIGRSRKVKGDKWTLTNKQCIIDYGTSDHIHITKRNPEVGNHGPHDCSRPDSTSNDKISEDVSSLVIAPDGVRQSTIQPPNAWVCCDSCHKWRCIPAKLADAIGDTNSRWTCKDNQDEAFDDCSVPQEKSNAEINAELDISEEEDGHGAPLDGKFNVMRQETALQQASWMHIRSNIFLHRSPKKQTIDEIMVCHCKPPLDGKFGCGDECLNRMLNIECVQGSCRCGDLCSNQQFQRKNYAKLNWFRSGKKGYGLQALEDIDEGKFLIEYVGEVLDLQSYESRQREYASKGHKHFYFMTLNGNEVIDACTKGNLGRFINHSCEPNCRTEKWIVNGEICIGLFALRDIKKGEEVTFDYNYVRVFGAAAKKCYCGAAHCRGCIGGDLLHKDIVVQSDSDEEFPEPFVIYENEDLSESDQGILTTSSSMVVADKKNTVIEVMHSSRILSSDDIVRNRMEGFATVGTAQIMENIVDSASAAMSGGHPSEDSESFPTEIETSGLFKRPDSSVTDTKMDSSSLSVDPKIQLSHAAKGRENAPMSCPRMKISRSKLVKNRKSSDGVAIDKDALLVPNMSEVVDNKCKKIMENSPNRDCETVEAKLGVLLDSSGGVCKRKDSSKGYLRLLALTSASGGGSDRATIQSIRDLSMILDAILKTKSRTVLTDIINKNGLQMLHLMLKKCKGNFNKIPILRKLLKVFEFLAEKEILTLEHINEAPSRVWLKSFRASILDLTEHQDKKVHQRARSFRDRWIPKLPRRSKCVDRSDRNVEHDRGPNSRFPGFDCKILEDSAPPVSLSGGGITRKRKSRWDERSEPDTDLRHNNQTNTDLGHGMIDDHDDDAPPPGFGLPSFDPPHLSTVTCCSRMVGVSDHMYPGPLKCPSQVPSAYLPKRFNSNLSVAYGIPLHTVQEFGTPQAAMVDGWVIAPGMVFHPFPPLPLCPRKPGNRDTHQCCGGVSTTSEVGATR